MLDQVPRAVCARFAEDPWHCQPWQHIRRRLWEADRLVWNWQQQKQDICSPNLLLHQQTVPRLTVEVGNAGASKHLWLGNLNTRLPRAVLKAVFEQHGPVDDVVTFPGRMYAFVNFQHSEDAARAQEALDGKEVGFSTSHCHCFYLTYMVLSLTGLPAAFACQHSICKCAASTQWHLKHSMSTMQLPV